MSGKGVEEYTKGGRVLSFIFRKRRVRVSPQTSSSPMKKRNCKGDYPVVTTRKASRQRRQQARGNLSVIHGVGSFSRRSAKSDVKLEKAKKEEPGAFPVRLVVGEEDRREEAQGNDGDPSSGSGRSCRRFGLSLFFGEITGEDFGGSDLGNLGL
ncbi:hypothetical protein U1Q18_035370 [Sarracenia purpurea var. burkii]